MQLAQARSGNYCTPTPIGQIATYGRVPPAQPARRWLCRRGNQSYSSAAGCSYGTWDGIRPESPAPGGRVSERPGTGSCHRTPPGTAGPSPPASGAVHQRPGGGRRAHTGHDGRSRRPTPRTCSAAHGGWNARSKRSTRASSLTIEYNAGLRRHRATGRCLWTLGHAPGQEYLLDRAPEAVESTAEVMTQTFRGSPRHAQYNRSRDRRLVEPRSPPTPTLSRRWTSSVAVTCGRWALDPAESNPSSSTWANGPASRAVGTHSRPTGAPMGRLATAVPAGLAPHDRHGWAPVQRGRRGHRAEPLLGLDRGRSLSTPHDRGVHVQHEARHNPATDDTTVRPVSAA